ncbi:MAG: PQQ-dependent sugar dehydrogenase [Verrucomicrobiales bacterium]
MRSLFTPTLPLRRDVLAAAAGSLLARTAGGAEPVAPYLNGAFPEAAPGGSGSWTTANAFPNLAFHDPVFVTQAPRGGKMFVVGKDGRIWSFDHDPEAAAKTLVLDLRASVQVTDNAGMGGIAFHPEFGDPASPNRGYFYLHYYYSPDPVPFAQTNDEAANPAYWRLVRFTIADGSETADPASEFVLIHQYDRHHWHNGGSLFFDNAGLLYATNGDAGGDYDAYADSQKLGEALFGGMLRIDVDMDLSRGHPIRRQPQVPGRPAGESYTQGYTIPDDNPWLDAGGAILEEFWCIGLRSPHRASYDPATGRIWVGDVGQERREEVNFIVKGGNYQWPYRDGTLTGYRAKPSPLIGTDQPPAFDYPRATGVCVIGGYVYRGREHASALNGRYLFADHEFRHIWAMDYTPGQVPAVEFLTDMPPGGFHANVSSFGTDNGGELYICKLEGRSRDDGKILKLARTGVTVPEPPNLLSQTGAFTDLATMQPAPGVTPYHLNHPFWSDGAVKSRFIAVPNDGTHDAPGERIGFSADGNWAFPAGTVFIKHFDLPGFGKLETRFLVRAADGSFYGVTYRWRADQSDADLLYSAEDADVPLAGGGSQAWAFPSRSDCMVCHTAARGYALGVRTAQLNRDFYNPLTARIENQIAAWSSRGVFDPAPGSGSDLPKLAHLGDAAAPLDHRIRSWLDANCAACHHPGGAQASFDARFSTPLADQGLINGAVQKTFGIAGAKVVAPGDLSRSILHHRFSSLDPDRMMPPLAKNVAHAEAVALVERWIGSRDASHYPGAGMTAQFFSDANLGDYALTRIDPAIDANWGAGAPDAALPADGWSVRWVGDLTPLISPTYTFYAAVDGGVRLWIGGDLKIDQWEHE